MSNPVITIYITNYNYGKYIRQAIESVLNQTFQDFELYIIDDGSTDNSKDIIEMYASHEKINIIYQKNKGLNITNNIALRLANGRYIMRLDADDYLTENALEEMVNLLEQDQDLGMVFPDYYLVDAKNNILSEVKRHDFKSEVELLDQPAHGACTVVRTEFLNAVGGYDESYSCQDGYELWIKFTAKFKVTNISKSLFYYRQHGENLTSNENRILDTRRSINDNFILNNEIKIPKTIGILPIRSTSIGGQLLTSIDIGGTRLIDLKLQNLLSSKSLDLIVVTSAEQSIKEIIEKDYKAEKRIRFIDRPPSLARYNVSLRGTIDHILDNEDISSRHFEAFMVLPLEYIFLEGNVIDDAVNALEIFKADSLISVRPESATFYQHHGTGMVSIMEQASYTQLEREALYKSAGGIHLTRIAPYKKEAKTLPGKVGHIVVNQKTAHGIFSNYDLQIAHLLIQKENLAARQQ